MESYQEIVEFMHSEAARYWSIGAVVALLIAIFGPALYERSRAHKK